mmetsp:Transcript_2693/g.6458  ORF Transcript_2693/g.6458 Transcript_2693/m.6458 type:complete len:92 (+) Transcript_2693:23-298(+)
MATKVAGLTKLLGRRITSPQGVFRPLRGGGHHHQEMADPAKYGHFAIPHVSSFHKNLAKGFGTVFWFWIFYRGYHDGGVVFLGRHPWHEEH